MGFIPKSYSLKELLNGLEEVFSGDSFVPEHIMIEIESIAQLEEKSRKNFNLSDRKILRLLQVGKKNREIADELSISQDTVKFHQKGLYLAL